MTILTGNSHYGRLIVLNMCCIFLLNKDLQIRERSGRSSKRGLGQEARYK